MCGCSGGCDSINTGVLPIGPTGSTGATGAQGLYGGFSYDWLFNTSTSTGPVAGDLRFNSATYSLVTAIYVSDTGTGSVNCDAFLDSLSNGSRFGHVKIFDINDSTKFWDGIITAVTDNGTDHTLTVTYVTHNGSFSEDDAIVLTFSPAGPVGTSVLYNTTTPVSTTNGAMTVLQSYTLAVNQLATNGDYIIVEADFDTDAVNQAKAIDLRIGGTVCHTKVTEFRQTMSQKASRFTAKITRQSTTTCFITFLHSNSNTVYQTTGDGRLFYETGFSVSDLSANTTLLEIRGRNIDGAPTETINCAQMVVTYYKKP